MKIGNSSDNLQLDKIGRSSVRGESRTSNSSSATQAAESISFSDLSSKLQELEKKLAASGEFDADRVETIKQAIRDGKFEINSEVVADKLLQSVQELFGKPA